MVESGGLPGAAIKNQRVGLRLRKLARSGFGCGFERVARLAGAAGDRGEGTPGRHVSRCDFRQPGREGARKLTLGPSVIFRLVEQHAALEVGLPHAPTVVIVGARRLHRQRVVGQGRLAQAQRFFRTGPQKNSVRILGRRFEDSVEMADGGVIAQP